MLTARPKNWFSWDYTVALGNQHVADIDVSWWREKGTLAVAGQRYEVHRERPLMGKFILGMNGTVVATAEKPSSLTRRFIIEHDSRRYELKPRNWLSRTFQLHEGSSVVGSLSAPGLLSRRMNVDLPETLPLPVRVFVMWLTVILWKRETEAAG
jgi:hypothetical protein